MLTTCTFNIITLLDCGLFLCYAMQLCYVMLCYVMLCYVMLCYAIMNYLCVCVDLCECMFSNPIIIAKSIPGFPAGSRGFGKDFFEFVVWGGGGGGRRGQRNVCTFLRVEPHPPLKKGPPSV